MGIVGPFKYTKRKSVSKKMPLAIKHLSLLNIYYLIAGYRSPSKRASHVSKHIKSSKLMHLDIILSSYPENQ